MLTASFTGGSSLRFCNSMSDFVYVFDEILSFIPVYSNANANKHYKCICLSFLRIVQLF